MIKISCWYDNEREKINKLRGVKYSVIFVFFLSVYIKMLSFKDTRDFLLLSCGMKFIKDGEFGLLSIQAVH